MQYAKLNTGASMPMIGYGVFLVEDGPVCVDAVKSAIETGYRHIDTASAYKNERSVGQAIKESGVAREDIFLTTKIFNDEQRSGDIEGAFSASLEKLGTDYVDLYLIHWPVKECFVNTWLALEEIYKSGRAKAIGVSNFHAHHLAAIQEVWTVTPAVNQVERHPRLNQKPLVELCQDLGIVFQAWSPLGGSRDIQAVRSGLLENEHLVAIGEKYGKSPAQVILRWDTQQGIVALPKSVTPSRMKQNLEVFDFSLTPEEIALIDGLNENTRAGSDPDNFSF